MWLAIDAFFLTFSPSVLCFCVRQLSEIARDCLALRGSAKIAKNFMVVVDSRAMAKKKGRKLKCRQPQILRVFFSQDYRDLIHRPNGADWFHSVPLPDGSRIAGAPTRRPQRPGQTMELSDR